MDGPKVRGAQHRRIKQANTILGVQMIPFFELTWERPDPKYGCARTPPHKLLAAYCGSWVIKTEDKWLEWSVLQAEYGWEVLLKAAKQTWVPSMSG